MTKILDLKVGRASKTALAEQIRAGITGAIENGVLLPGARLPSWVDLAAQLGMARSTVKTAYGRLTDAQLIVSSRAGGAKISEHAPAVRPSTNRTRSIDTDLQSDLYQHFLPGSAVFQMGVSASDCFPTTLFARLRSRAARDEFEAWPCPFPGSRRFPCLCPWRMLFT